MSSLALGLCRRNLERRGCNVGAGQVWAVCSAGGEGWEFRGMCGVGAGRQSVAACSIGNLTPVANRG